MIFNNEQCFSMIFNVNQWKSKKIIFSSIIYSICLCEPCSPYLSSSGTSPRPSLALRRPGTNRGSPRGRPIDPSYQLRIYFLNLILWSLSLATLEPNKRKGMKNNEKPWKTSLKINAFIDSAFFIHIRCSGQRPSSSHDPIARRYQSTIWTIWSHSSSNNAAPVKEQRRQSQSACEHLI